MESKARLSGPCHSNRTMLDVVTSRRQFLIATAGGAAAVSLPMVASPPKANGSPKIQTK